MSDHNHDETIAPCEVCGAWVCVECHPDDDHEMSWPVEGE